MTLAGDALKKTDTGFTIKLPSGAPIPTPTVYKGKIFIGTNNENPRDPKHQGDRSILLCFDEKTGEFLWQLVVPKLASGKVVICECRSTVTLRRVADVEPDRLILGQYGEIEIS